MEVAACLDQMVLDDIGHHVHASGLQRILNIVETLARIHLNDDVRPYVERNVIMKILDQSILVYMGHDGSSGVLLKHIVSFFLTRKLAIFESLSLADSLTSRVCFHFLRLVVSCHFKALKSENIKILRMSVTLRYC